MRDLETDLAAARTEISRLTTHLDVLRSEGGQNLDRLIEAVERRVLEKMHGDDEVGAAIQ
jgi:hypothetical protein